MQSVHIRPSCIDVPCGDPSRQVAALEGHFLWLQYRDSRTRVHLYHGFGPTAAFRFMRQEFEDDRDVRTEGSLGAAGVVGVEWTATPSIGILAEYNGAVLLTAARRDQPGEDASNEYGFRISSRGVRAGVSVYF